MLEYDRVGVSEGMNINKTNASKECDICHYCYFKDIGFKHERYLCNGCHNLMQIPINFNDVAIVFVKGSDYRIHFWYLSYYNAINITKNSYLKIFFFIIYKKWVKKFIIKETEKHY